MPGSLSVQTFPPWRLIIRSTVARPMPKPPNSASKGSSAMIRRQEEFRHFLMRLALQILLSYHERGNVAAALRSNNTALRAKRSSDGMSVDGRSVEEVAAVKAGNDAEEDHHPFAKRPLQN